MKKILILILILAGVYWLWGREKPEIKNAGKTGATIVAFGDSLTYGKGAPREQTYPAVLAELTGKNIVNLGLNGDTGAAAPRRLPQALEHRPYMVLIEFGGNDFMRGAAFEQTLASVSQIIDEVQAAGAVAVVVDTGGYYAMEKYSKAYKKLAREKGAVFVPGILDGIFGKKDLMSDQIHPNAAGYKIVAERVYKEIKDYL